MKLDSPGTIPAKANPSRPRTRAGALLPALLVFLLSLAMHAPFLGITPIAGTEGHRIFPAHEMVRSGWWTVPVLFGKPFLTKPPLHMWLIALSETITRHANVFTWRLPSAITGAALCAVVCLFGARWFGRVAGLIAGVCCAGMVTLWGQSQVADIDATNTLAAVLTALCGIELLVACPRRSWNWIIGAGLAFGATLMTKGPGGLPIVIGTWLWGAIVIVRERRVSAAAAARFLVPLAIGAGILTAYYFAAKASLRHHGLPEDWKGIEEGTSRLFATSITALAKSLAVIPTQLFAFALPVSLAIPLYFQRRFREAMDGRSRRIAAALLASVLISWGVCVISGMDNPRYGYPTLPPLCPLAGAVAVAMAGNALSRKSLRMTTIICALAYAAMAIILSVWSWRMSDANSLLPLLIGSTALALASALWMVGRVRVSWKAGWAFVPLILFSSMPFGVQRHVDRSATSGINTAQKLRQIVGAGSTVAVGGDITSKPETFYYAGVHVDFYPTRQQFMPANVPPGVWVVLDQGEHKRWLGKGAKLQHDQWLSRNGKTDYYVAWYPGT